MTVYVLEYLGMAWLRSGASISPGAPQEPFLVMTQISSAGSSGSVSTVVFSAKTQWIEIVAQNQAGFCLFGSSAASSITPTTITSTATEIVLANTRMQRGVTPNSKLFIWSS